MEAVMKKRTTHLTYSHSKNMLFRSEIILPVVLTLIIFLFIHGCATANFIQTGPSYTSKPDDCAIEVFSSKLPEREYEELGLLEGEGFLGGDTMEKILPKLKAEACKAGGDAIILQSAQKYVNDIDDENMHVTATVIKWVQ